MVKKKHTNKIQQVAAVTVAVVIAAAVSFVLSQRAGAASPSITVSVNSPWVAVTNFSPGSSVELGFDAGNDGGIDTTITQTSDGSGNSVFNLGSTSVRSGDRIVASDGSETKTLVVPILRTEYVNAESDVVAGVAEPYASVTVYVQQAGPPLGQLSTTADAGGAWSVDFTGTYDIEPDREVRAEVVDIDGDITNSGQRARVPYITAGYSQSGANSLIVSDFTPGTSVRMRVDFGGDGTFEIDQTKVVDNPWAVGWDLGGFDMLHPGDHIIATGGGWTKDLVTVPLRIEKMDPASDEVGGTATSGSLVTVGIDPIGPGPWVAFLSTTTNESGRWSIDFTDTFDFEEERGADASISDADGDRTTTSWMARSASFRTDLADGPPSGVTLLNFVPGTEVRVRADYGNDGGPMDGYDVDIADTVTSPYGFNVSFGGSGLLHAGDRIVVTGGGWEKSTILAPISVSTMNPDTDVVSGTASPGRTVDIYLNPPPGSPGGPAVAHLATTADSFGQWSVDFTPLWDLVVGQSGWAGVTDADGDVTSYSASAQVPVWSTSGFFPPVANPPEVNLVKAGASVAVRFSLGEFRGYDVFVDGYPKSQEIECGTSPSTIGTDGAYQPGKRVLTYGSTTNTYEFVWRTDKAWKGTCRQLVIQFADGSWMRANFRLG